MKLFSFFGTIALLASSVLSIPTFEDAAGTLEKRAFTAVKGVGGKVHPRLEIRQLQNTQPKQFTLFLLAMKEWEAQAQSGKLSYYGISGIHGVPRVSWDSVGECSSCSGANGYCTHDSILFMAWHRAYLALFEQELVSIAKSIAKKYPSSTRKSWTKAAKQMRLPYWDWAAKPASGNSLPQSVTAAQVTVNGPSGSQTIANPLAKYSFSSSSGEVFTPFTKWPTTLRWPTTNDASATSQTASVISAFNNIRASLQDQIYQIFSTCDTYAEVGLNTASAGTTKCSNSLEGIHNTIHTTTGGPSNKTFTGGHMAFLSNAAFDPLFWLHHANIDRFFAMWQTIYPDSYGASATQKTKTWTIAAGTTVNANSPLTPFHSDASGSFWTTTGVRDWTKFGYTYPEFADSDGSKASITNYIKKLYGPNASATAGSSKRDAAPEPELEVRATAPLTANNGSLFQYVANIQTSRYSQDGSYSIFLFNGDPASEDPTSWIFDSDLIGVMGVLSQSSMTADVTTTGSIPLTRTLTDCVSNGALSDLSEAVAVPFLTKNLRWRVSGPNGAIDPNSIPNFEISVYASTAQDEADSLPTWSQFIPLADVTKNKAGGATLSSLLGAINSTVSAVLN